MEEYLEDEVIIVESYGLYEDIEYDRLLDETENMWEVIQDWN